MLGSAYISKRLDLCPQDVPEAAAAWHQSLQTVRCAPQRVRLDRHIWLAADAERNSADPLLLYGVRGVLWMSGRPVRVTFEFASWSDCSSEVGVRPTGLAWPVGSERYGRRIGAALDAVSRAVSSKAHHFECTSDLDPKTRDHGDLPTTSSEPQRRQLRPRAIARRPVKARSKSRIKKVVASMGLTAFALFALAATWIGISIYRIEHAMHHVAVPASLLSKEHRDLLLVVRGANHSEQVLILDHSLGTTSALQIPKTLQVPLASGRSARIDTLSLQRPSTIIAGLERLGLHVSQFVGLDLHMFSSNSVIGQLASGRASASLLIADPFRATSIIEQIASHVYLGPGTPASAVLSLSAISADHLAAIPTTRDPAGQVVLSSMPRSGREGNL